MSSKKKLRRRVDLLAFIIAKLITPRFSNISSTLPNYKIVYFYGKR